MVWCVAAIVVSLMAVIIWEKLWLKPQRIRAVLKKQGITGPTPCFPLGNLLDMKRIQSQFSNDNLSSPSQPEQWFPSLFPFLQHWRKLYGSIFVYSTGRIQHVYVGDPKVIKELNRAKPMDLGRPTYVFKPLKPLLGSGILTVNGPSWSFQRNLIAPEFSLFKIQKMVDFMEESTKEIMRKWERIIAESGEKVAEIVIDDDMKDLTANIISKACFGGSYAQGNQIFAKLNSLQALVAKPNMLFGFLYHRILPTKENKEVWRLEKEIEQLVLQVVHHRELQNQNSTKDQNHQKDLLQIILDNISDDGAKNKKLKQKVIVDICKNIYFAGSETTAVLLTWTSILLCLHPRWQDRLRAEILETYPNNNMSPHCFRDMDKLRNMKQMSMVIHESLRLYGPGITTAREALKDVKVGEMLMPKGSNILVFITAMHRDPEIWGEDANEFKPERFEGGVSNACTYPQAYLPFGMGSQICVGQHFAIIEAKIALILLLSNFSFSLSPNYRHCPFYKLALSPKYGAPLLVTKL